jgi:hypothetical protein
VRIIAIGAIYLLLFNPRTQSNSYVIGAAPVALLATGAWLEGKHAQAIGGAAILLLWCTYHGAPSWGEYLIKPLGAIAVACWLAGTSGRAPGASLSTTRQATFHSSR